MRQRHKGQKGGECRRRMRRLSLKVACVFHCAYYSPRHASVFLSYSIQLKSLKRLFNEGRLVIDVLLAEVARSPFDVYPVPASLSLYLCKYLSSVRSGPHF